MKNTGLHKAIAALMVGGMILGVGATNVFASDINSKGKVNKANIKHTRNLKDFAKKGKGVLANDKNLLDSFVKSGTITQAQEDKTIQYFKDQAAQRKAEMNKIKAMTPEQKKAYFAGNTAKKQGPFDGLVSSGIISQAQLDSMKKSLPAHQGRGWGNPGKDVKDTAALDNALKTKLDGLVKAGTITQAQEDKIASSYKDLQTQRKAEMDKLKSMTKEQRQAYFADSANKSKLKVNPLGSLVSSGTITQAQADAVKNLMKGPFNGGFHRGLK